MLSDKEISLVEEVKEDLRITLVELMSNIGQYHIMNNSSIDVYIMNLYYAVLKDIVGLEEKVIDGHYKNMKDIMKTALRVREERLKKERGWD